MNFNLCILDLDVIVYRCGFAIEKYDKVTDTITVEPLKHALYNVNSMIRKCLELSGTDKFVGYITASGRSNFRFELFPEYKANRKNARKPVYYDEIREFLVRRWKAEVVEGQEADDACSIKQWESCLFNHEGIMIWNDNVTHAYRDSIIWSIDKDFNNVPGWHGNYTTGEIYYVNEKEALRNFYLQILTGDTADGIPRIKKGWRQKETEEKLSKAETENEMIDIVYNEMYDVMESMCDKGDLFSDYPVKLNMIKRGRLVWLRRKPEELWIPSHLTNLNL